MRRPSVVSLISFLLLILALSDCKPTTDPADDQATDPATELATELAPSAGGEEADGAWDPNFCNDETLLAEAGLTKTVLGQFIGFDCSADFFHCRKQGGGYRTYKKACGLGLVFDTTGTQNCNYDFNVKGCGFADKYGEACAQNEFICPLSEACVPLGKRCDDVYDCMLEEDEQNCPLCRAGEFPCVIEEACIPIAKRCNGIAECKDQTDELNCTECPNGGYFCRKSEQCIAAEQRCDGAKDCNYGEDEVMCRSAAEKTYLCGEQRHRVPMVQVCDGKNDCPDGTDEAYCTAGGFSGIHPSEIQAVQEKPALVGGEFHSHKTDDVATAQSTATRGHFQSGEVEYVHAQPAPQTVQQPIPVPVPVPAPAPPPRQPVAVARPPPKQPAPATPLRVVRPAASSNRPLFPRFDETDFIDKTHRIKPLAAKQGANTPADFPPGAVVVEVTAPPPSTQQQFPPPRPAVVPFRPPQPAQPLAAPPRLPPGALPAEEWLPRLSTLRQPLKPTARPSLFPQSTNRTAPATTIGPPIATPTQVQSTLKAAPRPSIPHRLLPFSPVTVPPPRHTNSHALQPLRSALERAAWSPVPVPLPLAPVPIPMPVTTASELESSGEEVDEQQTRTLEPLAHEEYFTYES